MSRLFGGVRALLAAAVLAVLLVGLPWVLLALGGPLLADLADRAGGPVGLIGVLTARDDGRVFLAALTVLGLAAWAMFALSAMLETYAVLRRRPALRLPGLRLTQLAAGALIGVILTGFAAPASTAATPVPPASASTLFVDDIRHTSEPDHHGTSPQPSTAERAGPVYTVRERDTLWDIAETYLGDPLRYREILQLNRDRPQPGGEVLTNASILQAGWTLQLPADAELTPGPGSVSVGPGDTLAEIAEEYYGDPSEWPRIAEANADRPQPGGETLSDPDLIRAGWTLDLPPVTPSPAAPPAAGTVTPEETGPQPQQPAPAPEPDRPPAAAAAPPPRDEQLPDAPPPVPATSPPAPETTTPAPAPSAAPAPDAGLDSGTGQDRTADGEDVVELPTALTVSALLASSALAAVALARRRQQRRRRHGRQVAMPGRGAARLERAYRAATARADVSFLDLALRSLSAKLAEQPDGDEPDILGAWLGPEQLRLILATPLHQAPAPFAAAADGAEWVLPVDAELPVTTDTAGQHLAPLPALASIARGGDEQLLVDLERLGALQVSGNPDRGRSLLRHLAVELATNTWSDQLSLVVVGFGAELAAVNPDRISHIASRDHVVAHLRDRLQESRQALDELAPGSVLAGRVHDIGADAWMPEILLIADHATSQNHQELDELLADLSRTGRSAIAVVATTHQDDGGDAEHSWRAHVDADGVLRLPRLTSQELRGEGIPADLVPYLVELFAVCDADDEPVPAADDPYLWAQGMDAGGALLAEPPPGRAELEAEPSSADAAAATAETSTAAEDDELLELDDGGIELEGGLGERPDEQHRGRLVEFSPPVRAADDRLAQVEQADPSLEEDLVDYQQDEATRPMIGILGEPMVRAPGTPPRHRVPWYSEVLVHLALHPHGVTADQLMTDLWPEGHTVSPVTLRQALSTARQWAGTSPHGGRHLPTIGSEGRYRLTSHLLDWDLFRRLRQRAQARAAAGHRDGARDDYAAALGLVRGPVLHPQRPGGYGWLAEPDQQPELLIPGHVIDTAHDLVELALADGDHEQAHWAVRVALLVDRDRTSERPLVDQMRVLHADGRTAEAERVANQLLELTEVDVPEDLQPDTSRAINTLFPGGLRRKTG